jgi:hypothetical protein
MSDSIAFCSCIGNELEALGTPIYRVICHCKTCQKHHGRPFNDECGYLLRDVKAIQEKVELKSYQSKYSPLLRGRCKKCKKVSFSLAKVLGGTLVMIPSELLATDKLPDCRAHVYYDRRVKDSNDSTKKYSGHIISQLYMQWVIVSSILRRKYA